MGKLRQSYGSDIQPKKKIKTSLYGETARVFKGLNIAFKGIILKEPQQLSH